MAGQPTLTFYKDVQEVLNLVPIQEGNVLFETSQKNIMIDDNGKREIYGGEGNTSIIDTNGIAVDKGGITSTQNIIDVMSEKIIEGAANSVNGYKFWAGTITEYNAIEIKDANTIYFIKEE